MHSGHIGDPVDRLRDEASQNRTLSECRNLGETALVVSAETKLRWSRVHGRVYIPSQCGGEGNPGFKRADVFLSRGFQEQSLPLHRVSKLLIASRGGRRLPKSLPWELNTQLVGEIPIQVDPAFHIFLLRLRRSSA